MSRTRIIEELRGRALELRQTHISWVLLGRDEVWKIKKPVDFGFLDFSSLEQRRRACVAEVELNRRLAPGAYLGVVPISVGGDGRATLDSDEEPIEWAVHMRRLPDADRADVRLAGGRLGRTEVEKVAERIAEFHAGARCDGYTASFGTPEAIEANVRENFAQTVRSVTEHISEAQAAEIERWQVGFLREHAPLFEDRIAAGRIRDGHGDLRLEHVYIDDAGRISIIDCIEFNERFRFADTSSDLAFLAMDLCEHGRVDLAEALVARYARASGDYDLYAVLDFYESYRAYVRAKIASITAADVEVPHEARAVAGREARRHYLLALSFERPLVVAPKVVAVGGVIASGKSTVADAIGFELSAPVVDADRTRKSMLGVEATHKVSDAAWTGSYAPEFTERVYEELFRRAEVVLSSGRPVVLDASFRSRELRDHARAVAERRGVPFRFVECRVDHDVCRERLRSRARTRSVSDGRLEIFDDFVARWEAVEELDPATHIVVDTGRPLSENLEKLRRGLEAWPPGLRG